MVLLISLAKNKKFTVFSRFTSFWWPVGLYSSRTIKRKRCQREILAGCSNKERKQIAFRKKRAVVDGLLIFRFSIKLVYSRLLSIFNLRQPGNAKRWKKLQPTQKDLMIASWRWIQVVDSYFYAAFSLRSDLNIFTIYLFFPIFPLNFEGVTWQQQIDRQISRISVPPSLAQHGLTH